ncbi:unnamed protein product [Blepharisma stoltei]|uniref:C2H2-type domain-containing protein n=1 Tax=Blepharisma stoltei TaxID=1481888 RepID=A0AAU9JUM8_9CILI|nr:unnamed protein product [Blepharisma stoltei]
MSSLNEERPFICDMCPLRFKRKQYLQRHMAVHSGDRNFVCEACHKTYKYKKGLNRHISKTHVDYWKELKKTHPKRKPSKPPMEKPQIKEETPAMNPTQEQLRVMWFFAMMSMQYFLCYAGRTNNNL